jgi:hypothetical protein
MILKRWTTANNAERLVMTYCLVPVKLELTVISDIWAPLADRTLYVAATVPDG